jgi:hypothetical protein
MGVSRARAALLAGFLTLGLGLGAQTAAARPLPNLKLSKISNPPATAEPGDNLAIKDTVKNAGERAAGASTTRFYLSANTKKSSGDSRLAGKQATSKLKPGEKARGHAHPGIPAAVPDGAYFLIACADDRRVVHESNEKDNCHSSTTKVAVAAPEPLVVTPYQINTGQIAAGTLVEISSIAVTATAANGDFWVEVQSGDPTFSGVNNSALEVVPAGAPPVVAAGDGIDITGIAHVPGAGSPGLTEESVTQVGSQSLDLPHVLSGPEISSHPPALNGALVEADDQSISSHSSGNWLMDAGFTVAHGLIGTLPGLSDGAPLSSVGGIADTTGSSLVVSPRNAGDIDAPPSLLDLDNVTAGHDCVYGVGESNVPVARVVLSSPAAGDTFITVVSGNTGVVTIAGGGVTVPTGQTSAMVNGTKLAAGTSTLTATGGAIQNTAQLTVRGNADPVDLASLSLSPGSIATGENSLATATLDCESPSGGTTVSTASDSAHATVPGPSIAILAGQTTGTFDVHGVSAGQATISATLGSTTKQQTLTVN